MSRASRTAHPPIPAMSTPIDRDVVMGPPPLPPQVAQSTSGDSRSRENGELPDKYRRLKRKYFELEEKYKETVIELRASGDRNVQWRNERNLLLDRIAELENAQAPHQYNMPVGSTAYPRSLLHPNAQRRFLHNLDKAITESEQEDASVDPILQSKHVGPNARRRMEAEAKERMEEEQREARRNARRPRGRVGAKEKEREGGPALGTLGVRGAGGSSVLDVREAPRGGAEREREGTGPPVTLAPPPGSQRDSRSASSPAPSIVVTTNGGSTRLRIKPPAPPAHEPSPPPPSPEREHRHAHHLHHHHEHPHEHEHRHHHHHEDDHPMETDDYEQERHRQRQREHELQREREIEAQRDREAQMERERIAHEERERERQHEMQRRELEDREREREIERERERERERDRDREREREREIEREREREREKERVLSLERERERERERQMVDRRPSPPPPMEPLEPSRVSPTESASARGPPMRKDSNSPHTPVVDDRYAPTSSSSAPPPPEHDHYRGYDHPPPRYDERGPPHPGSWGAWPHPQGGVPVPHGDYRYHPDPYEEERRRYYAQYEHGGSPAPMPMGAPAPMHSPHGVPPPPPPGYHYPPQIMLGPGGSRGVPYYPHPGGPGHGGPPPGSRAKPKRLKAHTVTSRSYSIPMVPRDKKGRPILPLNVGIMTVVSLGEICMREHFHTERYIFPVGYEVTRRYLSTVDPNGDAVYRCKILDGGDGPKFQISCEELPEPIIAGTATGAWSVIVRSANHIRNRQHSNSVSGPDFFGLGQNTIKHLIQELPGADRLRDYVWQNFVEGGPLGGRHAAVIPALPDGSQEAEEAAAESSTVVNSNGSAMSVIAMGATPSPQPGSSYKGEDGKELQIIHVDTPEGNGQPSGPHPMASIMDRTPMKSITFHQGQESAAREREREGRARRTSVHSLTSDEHRSPEEHGSAPPVRTNSLPHPSRTASHSPALPREAYSPRGYPERSPYAPPAPQAPPPQQAVPAPFATIMNAYNTAPRSPDSPYEAGPPNGGASRVRGTANGADR